MKESNSSLSILWKAGMLGRWMSSRSRVSQQSFRTLKSVTSGLLVSPKRVVKGAPMISSGMWWRQASQRICLLSSVCRITQHPLLTPVFEDVVSKPQAMIFSATPHSTSTSLIFSASTLPVDCNTQQLVLRFLHQETPPVCSLFHTPQAPSSASRQSLSDPHHRKTLLSLLLLAPSWRPPCVGWQRMLIG